MRSTVAPKGRRVMQTRSLEEWVGERGGAAAALWDIPHESNSRPCMRRRQSGKPVSAQMGLQEKAVTYQG